MSNNITKTIKESCDEFDKKFPPPPSFLDIQEIIEAWQRMQPFESYTATQAMMAGNEWKRRMTLWKQIKSHLLQSQIKVIEAVIMSLEKAKQDPYSIREKVFKEDEYWDKEKRWDNATEVGKFAFPYNSALEDQISSLNETLEFLKKSL